MNLESTPEKRGVIVNKIGFTAEDKTNDIDSDKQQQSMGMAKSFAITEEDNPLIQSNSLQIIIISTLCICSIFIVIGVRYFAGSDSNETATLSQFRDIICGSIGFLIGMPSGTQK